MKVTLSMEERVWLAFRAACIARKMQASSEVQTFMSEQLKKWGVAVEEQPKQPKKK